MRSYYRIQEANRVKQPVLSQIALHKPRTKSCANSSGKSANSEAKDLPPEEFAKVFQNPAGYIGIGVEFYGRIFVQPERDSEGTYLQVYGDDNFERSVIVAIQIP
ncbi:hypothetical protein [Melghiribacillus thermohalophilus]|uniref:hypothetical protein n=1 Tax=Melghiribacillus thermohalophilus TaxID=1324956 RepID=UPI0010469FAA|nr:hypothetical protein [Melghiribacillus thermohalophilus]